MRPVSYTHLDVYKRQSVAWSKALVTVGVLTAEEQAQLEEALNVLLEDRCV